MQYPSLLPFLDVPLPVFLAGCLAGIALCQVASGALRRADLSALWTALVALVGVALALGTDHGLPPAWGVGLSAALGLAGALLVRSFYTGTPGWFLPAVGVGAVAAVASAFVAPDQGASLVALYQGLAGAEGLVVAVVVLGHLKKNPDAGLFLGALVAFGVATGLGLLALGLVAALIVVTVIRFRRLRGARSAAELSVAQLTLINRSLCRFLPGAVLGLLDKKTIVDVNLGDHCQRFLSVMFIDIRNFGQLSQSMGPDDNFRFLNSYLRRMGPVVRRHDGVVDRYLGDGILALFPGDPCQAIEAAIDLRLALEEYNGHRAKCGYPAIEVGIGIHRGPVLLGTIGEDNRMESTVISDAVNAASGLEGLTRKFGKDILVSGEAVEALGTAALRFDLEYLHDETIKGLARPLKVYVLEPLAG